MQQKIEAADDSRRTVFRYERSEGGSELGFNGPPTMRSSGDGT